jgi:hypothetical protein
VGTLESFSSSEEVVKRVHIRVIEHSEEPAQGVHSNSFRSLVRRFPSGNTI